MKAEPYSNSVPLTEYLYSKAGSACKAVSGTFELSPVCNLSCKMCYIRMTEKQVRDSSRPILKLEQWLELARQAKDAGVLFLLLTGGEPFLWPDFWELYESLIRMGFLVTINTNGTMITPQTIQRLRKYPPKQINITLYGASDETYERLCGVSGMYARVDQAIRGLREAGIRVKINGTFTPHNVCDMAEVVEYASRHQLPLDATTYMLPPIRREPAMIGENNRFTPEEAAFWHLRCYELRNGPERYREFLQNILDGFGPPPSLEEGCIDPMDGQIRCRAGRTSFWVTWDGWLLPCGMMPQEKVDLAGRSFDQAWLELVDAAQKVRTSGICGSCANRKLCHPCGAIAACETGSTTGIPRYLCDMAQAMQQQARETLEKRKTDSDHCADQIQRRNGK